jgi:hypothetical protein
MIVVYLALGIGLFVVAGAFAALCQNLKDE